MDRPAAADWNPLVADVLGVPVPDAGILGQADSFTALGGTSLQAIALISLGQRRLALDADMSRLLGPDPLAGVLATARPYTETGPRPAETTCGRDYRELLPGQRPMLAAHLAGQDRPYHLMFTLEAPAPLDPRRTQDVLRTLAARHESMRTMFSASRPDRPRIVLPAPHAPRLLHQVLPDGTDAVATIHDLYGRLSGELLQPYARPPFVFVLTSCGNRSLLTMLAHHTLIDGWSIGVLWREFIDLYGLGRACLEGTAAAEAASPEWIAARLAAVAGSGALAAASARVAVRLDGAPRTVSLPTDLPPAAEADGAGARLSFQLSARTADEVTALARRCGVTVTTVLMSAWALVVGRRAGTGDLVLGVPAAGRFEAGMDGIVGLCTRIVPVRCRPGQPGVAAADYIRASAIALADALADADLPFERVVQELAAEVPDGRNPLAQAGFAAHHELVPDWLPAGGAVWRLHEGHCHGAVFDVLLYLQAWSERPRLALEYATSAVTAADAGELAESFQAVLAELARHPAADLAAVRALSAAQLRRLREIGSGGDFDTADDLWSRFEHWVRTTPDAPAVADGDLTLTYRELNRCALEQAFLLRECGVRAGDRVVLELPRSAAEAVAVLGILMLGAAYVAVDEKSTTQWRRHLAAAARPRARIGVTPAGQVWAGLADCARPGIADDTGRGPGTLPPHVTAPAGPAYVSFTSGSTGQPKGVVVSHRAVLRLAADPAMFADQPDPAMLRLAPLAFDASTLELLVPLASGGCVVVYPAGEPTPSDLAAFLSRNRVTCAWLTSGFFHLVGDHRPDALRGLRQVFTGGGVVSSAHVRRVLEHCPGLRVTNGYGPTENTTFTTTFHADGVDEVLDPLPIGSPVHGTSVRVVDPEGRLAPPGAVGELWATGPGLADGYLNDAERTAQSFIFDPDSSARVYRTGDLVRWGADGSLRFLGRNDRQVKIAGHRVELVDVERRIRAQDGVLDAVVFLAADDPAATRLYAAVKLGGADLALVRTGVESGLPPYARPQRWFGVGEFPLDRNGKIDFPALTALAAGSARAPAAPAAAAPGSAASASLAELEELIARTWVEALGTDDFDLDEAFFEVGGDSLRIGVVRRLIQERLDGQPIQLTDLYRFPTVQSLAGHLHSKRLP